VAPKRNNYTEKEDLYLCKAYKHVSTDPSIGAFQNADEFWRRIKSAFDYIVKKNLDEGQVFVDRKASSLTDRFQRKIGRETTKFNAELLNRIRLNESGKTEEDRINDAMEDYKMKNEGKKFLWKHCLKVMHTIPQYKVENPTPRESYQNESRPQSRSSNRPDSRRSSMASQEEDGDEEIILGSTQDSTGKDNTPGSTNNVASQLQYKNQKRPGGSKAAKAFKERSRIRDAYNAKKIQAMKELTRQTKRSADILKFSAHQNAISARVGHFIMLGQNSRALQLLNDTDDMVILPDEPEEKNSEEENSEDEEKEDNEDEEKEDVGKTNAPAGENNDEDEDEGTEEDDFANYQEV
jgi:hypothetical protein